jgi:hypothetical protein
VIRPGIRDWFRLPSFSRRLQQREVDDEIAAHIALRVERLMRQGVSEPVARDEAQRRFGPLLANRGRLYEAANAREVHLHMIDRLDAIRHDVLFATRQLRRAPTFTLAAVATLALGLGANATMFGTIDRLLFRPPAHVVDPARVVTVGVSMIGQNGPNAQCRSRGRSTKTFGVPPTPLPMLQPMRQRRSRSAKALSPVAFVACG